MIPCWDLVFRRYADPFPVLDAMIQYDDLAEFIRHAVDENEQDRLWELYLSQAAFSDQSFNNWKSGLFSVSGKDQGSRVEQEVDSVATVKRAESILYRLKLEG